MEEAIEPSFYAYPSLSAWFGRPLKPELRPISDAELISPVDGEVFQLGEVKDFKIGEVKGYDYDVRDFLGPVDFKTNPDMRLYMCVISLWPNNYHGFHSPTKWKVKEIVNIPGFELTVEKTIFRFLPRILEQDERVVLSGEWKYGYFSMAPVAALEVGNIIIYTDPVDEVAEIIATEHRQCDPPIEYTNGQKVGEYKFGSTMVLIFEAPRNFRFKFRCGEVIKYGQQLMEEERD
jgi:phosphatidylserine decarboxylase